MNFSAVSERTRLGRALRLPLKLIPREMILPVMQGPMRGKKWIARSMNHGCWLGSYEYTMQMAFQSTLKPGQVIFDLGANVGFYTLLASTLVGPTGKVYSFEPVPRNLHYLRRHLTLNLIDNCQVLEVAVGRHDGVSHFNFTHDHQAGHLTDAASGTEVRVVSLDQLVMSGELPPPDVIKCDIEGAEYDALHGASAILNQFRPVIFLSTHSRQLLRQCWDYLTGIGYHVTLFADPPEVEQKVLAVSRLKP
jgi:FkbM family methyltransferase